MSMNLTDERPTQVSFGIRSTGRRPKASRLSRVAPLTLFCATVFLLLSRICLSSTTGEAGVTVCSTEYFEVNATRGNSFQILPTKYANTCALLLGNVKVQLSAATVFT